VTDHRGTIGARDAARLLAEVEALAHLGVWEWDLTRNELRWSDELYQILGIAPYELPASFEVWLDRVHPEDLSTVKSYFTRARRDRGVDGVEYRVVRPTGEIRTLQARVRCTTDDDGTVRLIGADQDITETKEVAARLVFSDRMVSIGTLAGGVAHEINNPLATISANLQTMAESLHDPRIAEALQGVERIRNIVRGLAAFSRVDDDRRRPIELHHVLELAIGMTSHEIRHRARLVKAFGDVPPVLANEARLGHVFINLLVNAAEAIPEGNARDHEVRVVARTDDAGWAIVEIHDTGGGIPRAVQPRIFDPFFTTKAIGQGTGLGLSICHGIVRSLGGDITFRSERGAGTTFVVALPPAERTQPRPPAPARDGAPSTARGTLLIVDDEPLFASSLRRVLASEHVVTVANSGRAALDRLRRGERFDVVLCDLMMPEMTGADLHAELLALAPEP